jgi:hypothetical protein
MLEFCHWSTCPAAEDKTWASACSIGPRYLSVKKTATIERTTANAVANAVGTTNSKVIILQVIADPRLTSPKRKMPPYAESGKCAEGHALKPPLESLQKKPVMNGNYRKIPECILVASPKSDVEF